MSRRIGFAKCQSVVGITAVVGLALISTALQMAGDGQSSALANSADVNDGVARHLSQRQSHDLARDHGVKPTAATPTRRDSEPPPGIVAPVLAAASVPLVTPAGATPIDLSRWTTIQYEFGDQPDASWVLSSANSVATQTVNADASIFLSDFDATFNAIEGTWLVNTTDDDDFMGFVFGYQGRGEFYLFDWKRGSQTHRGFAERGMSIKAVKIPGNADPSSYDLWQTSGLENVTLLRHNTVSWIPLRNYRFRLEFVSGQFSIEVYDLGQSPEQLLERWTVDDATYPVGKFGFYNYSQGQVVYRGFTRQQLPQPDLVVTNVDASSLTGDWQTLEVQGSLSAEVKNAGDGSAALPFQVTFFEDMNFDGEFDPVADNVMASTTAGPLVAGESASVVVSLDSSILFRDNRVFAFADSGQRITELDEDNNIADSTAACRGTPQVGIFDPVQQWKRETFTQSPSFNQVMMTPIVIDLDLDGTPEVLFVTFSGGNYNGAGVLRAVRGDNGNEVFSITNSAHLVSGSSNLAAADIDGDGFPEIVATQQSDNRLICFEHDGTFKWLGETTDDISFAGAAIANLDGVGSPEIIVGRAVFNSDGTKRWQGTGPLGSFPFALVADIDLDGSPEIVTGGAVYSAAGNVPRWMFAGGASDFAAVANLDDDPVAEIVFVRSGSVSTFNHDGTRLWPTAVALPGGGRGGPPTIADFDGDGESEIAVAGNSRYVVIETDGTLKWSQVTQDGSSQATGSSVFDFDGDGQAEVVYKDERVFRVYDGSTGEVQVCIKSPSGTLFEYPVVADVDGDGQADILIAANDYAFNCSPPVSQCESSFPCCRTGICLYGSQSRSWVPTRNIWNQHTYHITNVNDDGTIPAVEANNWLFPESNPYNSYRQNVLSGNEPLALPDLTASFITLSCDDSFRVAAVRVGNGGAADAPAGVPVSFYEGNPANGGRLLGTTHTQFPLPPGLFEDVMATLSNDFNCAQTIYAVADDSGNSLSLLPGIDLIENGSFEQPGAGVLLVGVGDASIPGWNVIAGNVHLWADETIVGTGWLAADGTYSIDLDGSPGVSGTLQQTIPTIAGASYRLSFALSGNFYVAPGDKHVRVTVADQNQEFVANNDGGTLDNPIWVYHSIEFVAIGAETAVAFKSLTDVFGPAGWGPVIDDVKVRRLSTEGGIILECNEDNNIHHFAPQFDFDSLVDITLDVGVEFSNTTFNRKQNRLLVDAKARNAADEPIDSPLLMVIESFSEPTVTAFNADGFSPVGDPYFTFLDGLTDVKVLAAGADTPLRTLAFGNLEQRKVLFDYSWKGPANRAPQFVSFPPTAAVVDRPYRHTARAVDPDNDAISYRLGEGPAGMTIGDTSGEMNWLPSTGDIGLHNVTVLARDDAGGEAHQRYTVQVTAEPVNRPPLFTSAPITHVFPGAMYEYQARASDRDGDELTFSKCGGPDEMAVHEVGLVKWDFALPPEHDICLRVEDEFGASAEQRYRLTVGERATNPHGPVLFGTPGILAVVGQQYLYQPGASDADLEDILTFSLGENPVGMTISESGRIEWTPSAAQLDDHPVRLSVDDGNGGSASQAWTIRVLERLPNQPPVIDSVPTTFAIVNTAYEYNVHAVDPESAAIAYELVMPPAGMTLDRATGRLTWTPTAVGSVSVAIKASDPQNAFGSQVFDLRIIPQNEPPTISTSPVLTATIGGSYRYDVDATDPEAQQLTYRLLQAPTGMTISSFTGLITWTPTLSQLGQQSVTVRVSDSFLGAAVQTFVIDVATDTEPPTVAIALNGVWSNSQNEIVAFIHQTADVCVQGADNVGVVSRSLTLNGVDVPLDSVGCAKVTPTTLDPLEFVATAADAAGNEASTDRTTRVVDPNDQNPPQIAIHAPAPDVTINVLTDVIATITDNTPDSLDWEVRLSLAGSSDYRVIGEGSGSNVDNRVVASIDPTLLCNDTYALLIHANDGVHQKSFGFYIHVAGDFKPGRFTTSFTDLTVPVAGVPLTITRIYDSIDLRPGDFGPGWRLSLPGRVIDSAENGLRNGSRVYVDRPDGKRVGFVAVAVPFSFFFPFIATLEFIPEPGTTDSLRIAGSNEFFIFDGVLWDGFIDPLNPRHYILETRQRLVYEIDDTAGLKSIVDPNGNKITVTRDGLESTIGVELAFVRDAQGRITRIIEPDMDPADGVPPGEMRYEYHAITGDLVGVRDQGNNRTTLVYDQPRFPHYLTEVLDQLGRRGIRNEYDDDGRLIASIDADGNRIVYDRNIEGRQEVIRDRLGFPTVLIYDDRGNVIRRTDSFGESTEYVFNDKNRLIRETDCADRVKEFRYNDAGDLLSETNCSGGITAYTRRSDGQPLTRTNALGNITRYEYDATGNLIKETAPDGGITSHTYNADGQRTSTTNPLLDTEFMDYDALGRMIVHIDFSGARTDYAYNGAGDRISETKYRTRSDGIVEPVVTQFRYDARHLEIESIDALGHSTRKEYDAAGQLRKTTDPLGHVTENFYDVLGNLEAVRYPDGTIESYKYDPEGRRTRLTNRSRFTTAYCYDRLGRLLKTIHPDDTPDDPAVDPCQQTDNPYTEIAYDCVGRILSQFDERGNETKYDYTCSPNEQTVVDALNNATEHEFDLLGNRIRMTDSNGHTTRYEYDKMSRLARTVFHDGTFSRATYDLGGRKTADIDQDGKVTDYRHDEMGRLSAVILHDGGQDLETTYSYDELGNQITQTDAEGRTTRFEYDKLSRRTHRVLPLGQVEVMAYDPAGRMTAKTDFNGDTIRYQYDQVGRVLRETTPDGGFYQFAYAGTGKRVLERIVEPGEAPQDTVKEYDERDRLLFVSNPDGSSIAYEYDAAGNRTLLVATTPHVSTMAGYDFDALNRLSIVHHPDNGGISTYTYDDVGNRASLTLPNNTIATYEYDDLNRLTVLTNARGDGSIISRYAYTLSPSGQRTRVDETTPAGNPRIVEYSYDDVYRLTGEKITDPEHADLDIRYVYDKVGNRVMKTLLGPNGQSTIVYDYDDNDRLLTEVETVKVTSAFESKRDYYASAGILAPSRATYLMSITLLSATALMLVWPAVLLLPRRRGAGRRSRRQRVFLQSIGLVLLPVMFLDGNNAQRLHYSAIAFAAEGNIADAGITTTPTAYNYDENGNTLIRTKNNLNDVLTWDARKRLIGISQRIDVTTDATLSYVTDGTRTRKRVIGRETTRFLVDSNRPVSQLLIESATSDSGSISAAYFTHGDDLLALNSAQLHYYLFDGQMSVRQLSTASGAVSDSYTYDAFGIELYRSGASSNKFLYAGEQHDPNLGFYYLRERYYAPFVGRFLSQDPFSGLLGDPSSLHKYTYAKANPVQYRDPNGLFAIAIPKGLLILTLLVVLYYLIVPIMIVLAHLAAVFFTGHHDPECRKTCWIPALVKVHFTHDSGICPGAHIHINKYIVDRRDCKCYPADNHSKNSMTWCLPVPAIG